MCKFKVGMQVFDLRYGWGVVTDIQNEYTYPVSVTMGKIAGGGVRTYTIEGKTIAAHILPVLLLPEEVSPEYLTVCPRPKNKKTVKYKRWVVIYPDGRCETHMEKGQHDGIVDIREIEHEFEIEI